jgi:hypothetical protein
LTVLVLQPIIENGQVPEVIVHTVFPNNEFHASIRSAQRRVRLMGAWPYGMELPYRAELLSMLHNRLMRGTYVQVLILHPMGDSARQRTADMRILGQEEPSAAEIISEILIAFRGFLDQLPEEAGRLFEVRIFNGLPPARLYLSDDQAFCSFFGESDNRDGSNVRHYETSIISGLGYYVNEAFNRLWTSRDLVTLDDYWRLRVRISWPSDREPTADDRLVNYVVTGGGLILINQALFYDVGRDTLAVQLSQKVLGFSWDGTSGLRVMAFDRARDSRAAEVIASANLKYSAEDNIPRSFLEVQAVQS